MQVHYVHMGSQQSMAYVNAINEYREASQARVSKSSASASGVDLLPRRKISNYFMRFRKVPKISFILTYDMFLNLMNEILLSDCKSSIAS